MSRLLLWSFLAFPSFAWAMGDAGLFAAVLQGAVVGIFVLVVGIWALSSLLKKKRWLLVLLSVGGAFIGVLFENDDLDTQSKIFFFIQWLLIASIASRIFAALWTTLDLSKPPR